MALVIGGSDAFLETWDKEILDILRIFSGIREGSLTDTEIKTLDRIVQNDRIIKITEEITKKISFNFMEQINGELGRLAKYSLKAILDTTISGDSGMIASMIIMGYKIKKS